ncbi:MAG: bifunctional non-ous end joining protein LigD, partial [Chthoniobacter sp.]|nr:bifunctional non-ous end joining protein LigD [Chthoniobacter sp.]
FVIQKHDASRLHYDFRLELDGVLKSWAVPKGVPFAKGDRRLAMHVEDHPLDYARFEGIIPKGQYGGGTVMVWDIGTWEPMGSPNPARDLAEGKLHFALRGKKLDGEWTLIAIKNAREENAWLLLKSGEAIHAISKKRDDESVLSGRTMARIAAERDAEWQSNRKQDTSGRPFKENIRGKMKELGKPESRKKIPLVRAKKSATSFPAFLPSLSKNLPRTKPAFVEPMKAKLADAPPAGEGWIYELKFDGFRALAIKRGQTVELLSRNNKDLSKKFPDLIPAVQGLRVENAVIDGEIVALDEQGRSSFQLLQAYEMNEEQPPICFYAFDLINLDGRNLASLPLTDRKAALEKLLGDAPESIRFSASLSGDVHKLLAEVKQRGLEGVIGKRSDSLYEIGKRSGSWVKLKVTNEQEFVIGGYTAPQGARKFFGALLVGFYEKKQLVFTAKVGTGFSEKLLRELHRRFASERRESCPFVNLPTKRSGRWGQGITNAEMKRCTWIEPRFVCQVRFTEWTRDAGLRHPAFLGMRDDKDPREVVREKPAG